MSHCLAGTLTLHCKDSACNSYNEMLLLLFNSSIICQVEKIELPWYNIHRWFKKSLTKVCGYFQLMCCNKDAVEIVYIFHILMICRSRRSSSRTTVRSRTYKGDFQMEECLKVTIETYNQI